MELSTALLEVTGQPLEWHRMKSHHKDYPVDPVASNWCSKLRVILFPSWLAFATINIEMHLQIHGWFMSMYDKTHYNIVN